MSNLRFGVIAAGLFVLAFVGISWASKGFPVMVYKAQPLKPDPRLPTFEESVKQGLRKDWENSKTAQSDNDKGRDKLRLELWQAAIGYNLSPCDKTMKKNLVEALTKYINAWSEMAGCRNSFCGDDKKLDAAAAAFKTPADARVKATLREAFDKGGITKDDFPKAVRNNVYMFSGMPFGEPEQACGGGRRAESMQ
jgi:hypothetical protein